MSPEPVLETWIYGGVRLKDGKRVWSFIDGHGQPWTHQKDQKLHTIGGKFERPMVRALADDGTTTGISFYGEWRYTGEKIDAETRAEMEALDVTSRTRLAAITRDKNDARVKALDEAMEPLLAIAKKLHFGSERDAFVAHVIRRLTSGW